MILATTVYLMEMDKMYIKKQLSSYKRDDEDEDEEEKINDDADTYTSDDGDDEEQIEEENEKENAEPIQMKCDDTIFVEEYDDEHSEPMKRYGTHCNIESTHPEPLTIVDQPMYGFYDLQWDLMNQRNDGAEEGWVSLDNPMNLNVKFTQDIEQSEDLDDTSALHGNRFNMLCLNRPMLLVLHPDRYKCNNKYSIVNEAPCCVEAIVNKFIEHHVYFERLLFSGIEMDIDLIDLISKLILRAPKLCFIESKVIDNRKHNIDIIFSGSMFGNSELIVLLCNLSTIDKHIYLTIKDNHHLKANVELFEQIMMVLTYCPRIQIEFLGCSYAFMKDPTYMIFLDAYANITYKDLKGWELSIGDDF